MAAQKDIETDLTLDLGSDISPEEFVAAIKNFFGYIREISNAQSGSGVGVDFTVQVKKGSNLIGVVPSKASPPANVEMIYNMAEHGVAALMGGNIDDAGISEKAIGHLKSLSDFSQNTVSQHEINLWVRKKPIRIGAEISKTIRDEWEKDYHDYGTLEGRLEAIQDTAGGLRIRVKDFLFPKAINCIVPEKMIETVFASFRRRVEIEGKIHYRKDGTPISIEAGHIDLLPDDDDLPSVSDVRGIMGAA